ncbi:MAG: hypothetical protein HDQ96_12535 [Lachnospiraceae bacterium]|nr:hypothetical protein [Lachnospiraceae bacterium]
MITLFRMLRLLQLKTKWKLAFWQFIDRQAMELIKNPEELEKKFISEIAKIIHEDNILNNVSKEVNNATKSL